MIWWVNLHDSVDPDYECIYTVLADDAAGAVVFAEAHNPGRVAIDAWPAG